MSWRFRTAQEKVPKNAQVTRWIWWFLASPWGEWDLIQAGRRCRNQNRDVNVHVCLKVRRRHHTKYHDIFRQDLQSCNCFSSEFSIAETALKSRSGAEKLLRLIDIEKPMQRLPEQNSPQPHRKPLPDRKTVLLRICEVPPFGFAGSWG